MGPPLYMRSIVDQNIVVRCMTVYVHTYTMALGSQPLTETSTRNISWRGLRQLMYMADNIFISDHLEIWEPQPPGTLLGYVQGLLYVCLKKTEVLHFSQFKAKGQF
jgi:hypothetical protein